MSITIVTPVLNGADYLADALGSVHRQHQTDFECLVVDGGSTDNTEDIVSEFRARDPRFRFLSEPGCSQYEAIDIGFSKAGGDVIAWLNADDMYTPWAFSAVERAFSNDSRVEWLTGFPAQWDAKGNLTAIKPLAGWPRQLIAGGWFREGLLGYLQQESMFFRRRLYAELDGSERGAFRSAKLAGDFLLWRSFAARAELQTLPTVLGGFRRHGSNRSSVHADSYLGEVMQSRPQALPSFMAGPVRSAFLKWSARQALKLSLDAVAQPE